MASFAITYQNALEQALWAVKERAEQAKRVKVAFIANSLIETI